MTQGIDISTRQHPRAVFVAFLFFFSGFAALVYQVMWMRRLSLFFGSDVYSAAITLSCFMGGLSLGSWLVERVVDRLRNPLLWYGGIEIAIGLYALVFQPLLGAFHPLLQSIYASHFETTPVVYQAVRISIAAGMLLLPTALMGVTLPLVVRSFVRRDDEMARFGGYFYAINTLGALVGTLVAAFGLFPFLGAARTTLVAVVINVAVGALVAVVACKDRDPGCEAVPEESMQTDEAGPRASSYDESQARAALWGIAVSGLAALGLEVVWTRVLTQSFSATVYSFAIMLACFLFGIFLGSRLVAARADREANPMKLFGSIELGIGVYVLTLPLLGMLIPKLFGLLVWAGTGLLGGRFGIASVVSMVVVSGAFILLPTVLLGATFPVAVRLCTPRAGRAGFGTARVYAANTAGAILGSLLAGFLLVPVLGSRGSLVALGFVFCANGLFLLACASHQGAAHCRRRGVVVPVAIGGLAAGLALIMPRQTVLNYNLQASTKPEVIYHGEGIAHSVDIVRSTNNQVVMMVDGNIEADTSHIQRRHFILKAHLPLLLHDAPRDVAVVGLGLGITVSATARNPEVENIQLIELSPEMVQAHAFLKEVTGGVLEHPKVSLRIDDGRNFLAMTGRRFDMITADPIHPRITGVGYLYTREYYEGIRRRLKPGGVVCQWMPMYHISRESFDVAFRTFSEVFEHATFWYVRGHGLFVAGDRPPALDVGRLRQRMADPAVSADLGSIDIGSAEELISHLLMGPSQIKSYLARSGGGVLNTDDNAYLEYRTPFEFLGTTGDVLKGLVSAAGYDESLLSGVTDSGRTSIRDTWEARRARLLQELEEPLR